jgi:hypothetical protein
MLTKVVSKEVDRLMVQRKHAVTSPNTIETISTKLGLIIYIFGRSSDSTMKTLLIPIGAALLASVLSVYGCYLVGMPESELYIAALVAVAVSVPTAVTVARFKKTR